MGPFARTGQAAAGAPRRRRHWNLLSDLPWRPSRLDPETPRERAGDGAITELAVGRRLEQGVALAAGEKPAGGELPKERIGNDVSYDISNGVSAQELAGRTKLTTCR